MQDPLFQNDAELDALLDEALSPDSVPGGVPVDLNARILAALPLAAAAAAREEVAVIGRIGFFSSVAFKRFAAAILVAASVGLAVLGYTITRDASQLADQKRIAAEQNHAAQQLAFAKLSDEVKAAPVTTSAARETFVVADSKLDHRIDSLKAGANEAALTAAVDSWSNVASSLEAALDAMDAEPDNG